MDLEERMQQPGEQVRIINFLNDNTKGWYKRIVSLCGYSRITINVLRNGQDWFSYTSFNSDDGTITGTKEGIHNPDIYVQVEAQVLYSILDDMEQNGEEIAKSPVEYALQKHNHFQMPLPQRARIVSHLTKGAAKKAMGYIGSLIYS